MTGLPVFRSHISLSFLSLKQKELKLMVFWQTPTNVNMETWTPLNLPFYFWDANTFTFPVSRTMSIFILQRYPPCISFPWLWKKMSLKKNQVQTIDCLLWISQVLKSCCVNELKWLSCPVKVGFLAVWQQLADNFPV